MSDVDEDFPPILADWDMQTESFSKTAYRATKQAGTKDLKQLADLLELEEVKSFSCTYVLHKKGKDKFRLEASFAADVRQLCSLSLEIVAHRLEGDFSLSLWPAGKVDQYYESSGQRQGDELEFKNVSDSDENDFLEPEPYENGILPIGRLVYEHLAGEVNPYFKAEGATFRRTPENDLAKPENPFAVLKKIKRGQ